MSADRNPHAQQMADESMVRTLAAQASAIWPQEERLLARYELAPESRIADIGCGSGEITSRLAMLYPRAGAHRLREPPLRLACPAPAVCSG